DQGVFAGVERAPKSVKLAFGPETTIVHALNCSALVHALPWPWRTSRTVGLAAVLGLKIPVAVSGAVRRHSLYRRGPPAPACLPSCVSTKNASIFAGRVNARAPALPFASLKVNVQTSPCRVWTSS